ncbi:MAG: hypothetical protein R3A12_13505 [Ignavibacteria bacterium]
MLNKVHGLMKSPDEYDTITLQSEQEVVKELMGNVQELTQSEDVKRFSS